MPTASPQGFEPSSIETAAAKLLCAVWLSSYVLTPHCLSLKMMVFVILLIVLSLFIAGTLHTFYCTLSLQAAGVAAGVMLVASPQGFKPPLDETEATELAGGSLFGGSLLRLGDDGVRFLIKAAVVPPVAFGALLAISGASGL